MSAQNRTQDKGGKPAGIEDKVLAVAVEDKAAAAVVEAKDEAEAPEGVKVILSTHYEYQGDHYAPGDTVVVDENTAYSITTGGFARLA